MAGLAAAPLPGREASRRSAGGGAATGHHPATVHVRDYTRKRNGHEEHVGSYDRRNPDQGSETPRLSLVADRRTERPHQAAAPTPRAWEGQPNQAWRERIAQEETNQPSGDYGYGKRSNDPQSTAKGRYQINNPTLIEAGWKDRQSGTWTERAKRSGVSSDTEFMQNPAAQEAALGDVVRIYEKQLQGNGALESSGRTISGLEGSPVTITLGGLVAAAHRAGANMVAQYLQHLAQGGSAASAGSRLRSFRQVEGRLRAYAETPYQRMSP